MTQSWTEHTWQLACDTLNLHVVILYGFIMSSTNNEQYVFLVSYLVEKLLIRAEKNDSKIIHI
jgi:hypothetical protein